jgi:hypothetical protein
LNFYRETHIALRENLTNNEIIKNFIDPIKKLEMIMNPSQTVKILKIAQNSQFNNEKKRIKWDNTNLGQTIKYCLIPRFLIVEVNKLLSI